MRPISWLMLATHVPASGTGGGMVRYAVELAAALAQRPDVELTIMVRPESREFFTELLGGAASLGHAPPGPTALRSLLERAGQGSATFRRQFDVVHGTKHLLPWRTGGHRVLTVHDMLMIDLPKDFGLAKRTLLKRPYLSSIRSADTLLCVSTATRDRMLDFVPAAADRAEVVSLAASSALLTVQPQPVPELRGHEFAVMVGDASPRKNLGFIVDLWPEVLAQRPQARLAIIGPPSWGAPDRGLMYHVLAERGDLVPLGHVSDAVLRWCYEHAEVALCPSQAEGFGLPAAEALALGTPLITSTDPALCEVSGAGVPHLEATDRASWVSAIVQQFSLGSSARSDSNGLVRSWHDVAADSVAAVRHRL